LKYVELPVLIDHRQIGWAENDKGNMQEDDITILVIDTGNPDLRPGAISKNYGLPFVRP
jgi:hypothetical protein